MLQVSVGELFLAAWSVFGCMCKCISDFAVCSNETHYALVKSCFDNGQCRRDFQYSWYVAFFWLIHDFNEIYIKFLPRPYRCCCLLIGEHSIVTAQREIV